MRKPDPKNPYQIRGFPGHRTLPDRSGLDPLDSYSEGYHMVGILIRRMFTLKLRTRKTGYLVLMFIFGVAPFGLLLAVMLDSFRYLSYLSPSKWIVIPFWIIVLLVPGLLTLNLFLCIRDLIRSKIS